MQSLLTAVRTTTLAIVAASLLVGCGSSDTSSGAGSKQSDSASGVYQGSFMADYSNKVSIEKKQRSVHMVVKPSGAVEMKHEGRTYSGTMQGSKFRVTSNEGGGTLHQFSATGTVANGRATGFLDNRFADLEDHIFIRTSGNFDIPKVGG